MKISKMQTRRLCNAYTQVLAAKELGISEQYLTQLETGKATASHNLLVRMSNLYDCHKQDLIENEGSVTHQ